MIRTIRPKIDVFGNFTDPRLVEKIVETSFPPCQKRPLRNHHRSPNNLKLPDSETL